LSAWICDDPLPKDISQRGTYHHVYLLEVIWELRVERHNEMRLDPEEYVHEQAFFVPFCKAQEPTS
jgi:hypothetical protein